MSAPSPAPRSAGGNQNPPLPTPTGTHMNGVTANTSVANASGGGMTGGGGGGSVMSQQNLNQIVSTDPQVRMHINCKHLYWACIA